MNLFLLLVQTMLSLAIASLYVSLDEFISLPRMSYYIVGIVLVTIAGVSVYLTCERLNERLRLPKRRILLETPFGILVQEDDHYKIEK